MFLKSNTEAPADLESDQYLISLFSGWHRDVASSGGEHGVCSHGRKDGQTRQLSESSFIRAPLQSMEEEPIASSLS